MNTYNIYEKKELLHQLKADYFYLEDGMTYFYIYIHGGPTEPDCEPEVELVHTVPYETLYIITKAN